MSITLKINSPMKTVLRPAFLIALILGLAASVFAETTPDRIKTMLLTGRSGKYHNWEGTSPALHKHLVDAGIFDVELVVAPPSPESLEGFAPDWSTYDVVVLDYEGAEWPEATKASFVEYVKNGGNLVSIHASNNSFPYWPEYNEMLGIGGWGGSSLHSPPLYPDDPSKHPSRDESWGPRVHWRGCEAIHDNSPGKAGHPPQHEFLVTVRDLDHPITKGLPEMWLHSNDELYSGLRGPAKNMHILATGFANPEMRGASPYNEPMLFTVSFGNGRIFHSTFGHVGPKDGPDAKSMHSVGFITTFLRGTEWAATGKVTQEVPEDFPHAYKVSIRPGDSD